MRNVILVFIVVVMVGCVAKTQMLTDYSTFDKETAENQMRPGKNTIKGSALLRQAGGGVVTCAGNEVTLIPYSNYARERMTALYPNESSGINSFLPYSNPPMVERRFLSSDTDYERLLKKTQCNAQGFFTFDNLADGNYYIVTHILWYVGRGAPQGGSLMKKASVSGGETKEVVVTHP